MNLASVDLNLLVTLDAILTERHLTRAGEQLGLSQPSMSHALGRLRRLFDDELLIRIGREYELTPLAVELLEAADGNSLPHIVWLGGYRSDMTGTKAVELAGLAARLGTGCIRFDYSGHGASGGAFIDGTISRWLEESLAVIDHARASLGTRRILVVGSSMGGWLALRVAQELRRRGRENR